MAGPQPLLDDISNSSEEFFVCDTTEQVHLHTIASTLFLSDQNWLPCGSAGLARELSDFIRKKGQSNTEDETIRSDKPILLVIGSQNQVSVDQLLLAQEELKIPLLKLNVELPATSPKNVAMLNSLFKEATALLQSGKIVAVTSAFSTYVPELKNSMAGIVAGLVETITKHMSLQGLFLCGGDTALEVCKLLNIGMIQVQGEVETGVPAGYFFDVRGKRTKVVTKAGGFGRPDAIIKSISYLKRGNFQ
jgi:uncharacterized protein YgbK (DUF1537 family)